VQEEEKWYCPTKSSTVGNNDSAIIFHLAKSAPPGFVQFIKKKLEVVKLLSSYLGEYTDEGFSYN